jgi:hypothetical protein
MTEDPAFEARQIIRAARSATLATQPTASPSRAS